MINTRNILVSLLSGVMFTAFAVYVFSGRIADSLALPFYAGTFVFCVVVQYLLFVVADRIVKKGNS